MIGRLLGVGAVVEQELGDLVRAERRCGTERRHLRERRRRELVRVRARGEQRPDGVGVVREDRDVKRREPVGTALSGRGQAVRLADEQPVPRVERRVGRADRLEDLAAAAVERAHQRREPLLVARGRSVRLAREQLAHALGVAVVDQLEDRHRDEIESGHAERLCRCPHR